MHNALHIWMCANKYLYTFKHIYFLTESTHVLRLSRETRSAIFNYLHFLLFLIFELSPKVIWGCRHIVKYQRKSESVGDRIMVISYINYFLTGRKISHGKEDHWFCCAGQRRRKGSLHTTWGWFLHMAEGVAMASMPFSLTSTKDPCRILDRYQSLFDDTQEEEPWPARRHQILKKTCKQPTSSGKGAQHH